MTVVQFDLSFDPADAAHASEADGGLARDVLRALEEHGREGHPSIPHLTALASDTPPSPFDVAATAFEAGARLFLGRVAADGVLRTGGHPAIAHSLTQRKATSWEAHPDTPYWEVDWAAAFREVGAQYAQGSFRIAPEIPGRHCLALMSQTATDRASAIEAFYAERAGGDLFDPVSANASFLAEAMPGFVDLDVCLRQYRAAQLGAS